MGDLYDDIDRQATISRLDNRVRQLEEIQGVFSEARRLLDNGKHNITMRGQSEYQLNLISPFPSALTEAYLNIYTEVDLTDLYLLEYVQRGLTMVNPSVELVKGFGIPEADEALYGIWQIFPQVWDDFYLVIMHSSFYKSEKMWFLRGKYKDFLDEHFINPRMEFGEQLQRLYPANFSEFGNVFYSLYKDV